MSLSIGTPEPRRRTVAPRKPAAKKPAASAARGRSSSLGRAAQLFRRFEQVLAAGDHPFSQLRHDFGEWCEADGDTAPPSVNQLAAWLTAAGLTKCRRGRAKVTIYVKRGARLAA